VGLGAEVIPTREEIEAEWCRRKFSRFIRKAWPLVDPKPLVWGKHVDAIADHLQAVAEGRVKRLIINIPPGHAKSMLVSVLWPAWMWARKPEWGLLCASYADDVVNRDAVKARRLMNDPWYQRHFRGPVTKLVDGEPKVFPAWKFQEDQNNKSYYANTRGGLRISLTPKGQGTGHRGDALIVDDPLNAEDAHSKVERDKVIRWFTESMSSRFNEQRDAIKVIIMQRLHEEDLTGYLLKNAPGEYEHLCLPSEFEPKRAYRTSVGQDWRTEEGEPLFPELFPKDVLEKAKRPGVGMGAQAFAGQHQQRPSAAEGNLVKRAWLARRWHRAGTLVPEHMETRTLPSKWDELVLILDASFKDTEASDLVCLGCMARAGVDKFLLDVTWGKMDFVGTVPAVLDMYNGAQKRWGRRPDAILIEDKANGSAVISVLKKKVPRIKEVNPGKDSKGSRLLAVTGDMECGNYWIPLDADWVGAYVEELVGFPKAAHDDAVDMTSYGLMRLGAHSGAAKFEALGNSDNLRAGAR
jgi:predicted phage terminase large subunit-like protein